MKKKIAPEPMTATIPFVQETFDRFNALCFGGMLPAIPIVLTRARTFLGKIEYGRWNRDFRMKISTCFDLPREELEDVVLHEMIHYHIALHRMRDSSVHGELFRRMMDHINREYGRHIRVSHRGSAAQNLLAGGGNIRKHHICVSTFRDGRQGITICTPAKIELIRKILPRYFDIERMDWFVSTDLFFNRFPRSHTPRIFMISASDLETHLKGSTELFLLDK